jgi:predicted NBD/HSP70 family sugar kinase
MFVDKYDKPRSRVQPMTAAARTPQLRRSNLALVLDQLRRRGSCSRSELVAATGLTRSAIAGLVGELETLGLVVEKAPARDGRPGRPSPVVQVDDRCVEALAIEIFVDEIGAAFVALDGSVVASARIARPRARVAAAETVADVAELVARLDEQVRDASPSRTRRRLIGCGVSVPGLVRELDGVVVAAPNLGWIDVALAESITSALHLRVPVAVGNDADLGALAESRFGAGVGSDHMIFVSGEVGVGGGLVAAGRPVVGHLGFAGEIGHLPVNPDGRRCPCGSIGCWETEVGEAALLERAGLDPDGGRAAVEELLDRAAAGEKRALDALAIEARWLAIGIAGLVNVLDPDTVVLGGLFARVLPALRSRLDAELADRRYVAARRDVAVVGARLGPLAVTVGAAELAFGPLLDDPAGVMSASVA